MPPLSLMFKTVSTDCNLDCHYCYYRQSLEGSRVRRRLDRSMLETLIPQYMEYVADTGAARLTWQGGEPTLAGLEFFRWVIELERRHARPGTSLHNALQTNAVLIDDEWAAFLAEHGFLVGVSLDGPEELHDTLRTDRGGHGSFRRVMAGIEALRRAAVEFNVLCVVGPHNVARPRELMRFFRREQFGYLQFIPAMDYQGTEPEAPARYLVTPEEYGRFLVELFEEWYEQGRPRVSIRIFDNFLQSYLGVPNDACIHGDVCDGGLIVEHNGDVYPCDFYVAPPWKLGTAGETTLAEMAGSPARWGFIARKQPLPAACQACAYREQCKGGCPRNRSVLGGGGQSPDYFCASYKALFGHAGEQLAAMRERILRRVRFEEELEVATLQRKPAPGRNDPCLCGSGRKQKACCGDPALTNSYVFRQG